MKVIECPDLSSNKFVSIFLNLDNSSYKFTFRWNEYCDCCFLNIYDNNGTGVLTGIALTNGRKIVTDNRLLPALVFIHKDGLNEEPTVSSFKDYLIYANTSE